MIKRASAVFAAAMLALTGCSGEDGDPGAKGADGTSCTVTDNGDGTATVACNDGTTATIESGTDGTNGTNGQSCLLSSNPDGTRTLSCPDGSTVVLPAVTLAGSVNVTNAAAAVDGGDVVVTFNVKLNGANSNAFTNKASGYRYVGADSANAVRFDIATGGYTLASNGNGDYTARIAGAATTTPTTFMLRVNTGVTSVAGTVIAHLNGQPKPTMTDRACMNCHGDKVFHSGSHKTSRGDPEGVGACVVCHTRANSSETRLGIASTVDATGVITAVGTAPGTRLMGYVHGIHNSHNMPDGVYSRNGSTAASSQFSIGFPSYMNNCSTCHDTAENLELVMQKPVSFQTCMSCHDNWDGFSFSSATAAPFKPTHVGFTATTNCSSCHDGSFAPGKVEGYHGKRQAYTPRSGLLFDGKDQSIEFGKRVAMKIDEITRDDSDPDAKKLVVKWSATFDGAAVDPCNTDFAAGPVFLGQTADTCAAGVTPCNATTNLSGRAASNMNLLQAYAVGNDWVSEGVGTAPGQPIAENVTPANTVCAENVATTTIAAATTTAAKGVLGLQGKPQVRFESTDRTGAPYTRIITVRSPSPTREFVTATGAEPTDKRRAITDTAKCLTCHQGSLYQHGGNRVDSVDLCVMCHNPAANEKNVRVNMGVDASEAYDGKPGQTYDFRYMLHAIHSAGSTNAALVYYRTNGVYAFGSEAAIGALPNWPGAGCFDVSGSDQSATSGAASTGTQCGTPAPAAGPGIPAKKNHNEIVVHYPRGLNECGACHTASTVTLPSTSTAVAVTTYDAGAAPWGVQTDDVLMSPATASCMSCHQSGDAGLQAGLRAHAFQNSWTPATFTGGRAEILGGGASESCLLCHGTGRVSDFNAKHAGGGH